MNDGGEAGQKFAQNDSSQNRTVAQWGDPQSGSNSIFDQTKVNCINHSVSLFTQAPKSDPRDD